MAKDEVSLKPTSFTQMDMVRDLITVDLDWNNRVNLSKKTEWKRDNEEAARVGQEVSELADLIERSGNVTPLTVSLRADGTYFLVAGFRRISAIDLLNQQAEKEGKDRPWKVIPVMVKAMTPVEEVEWNLLENMARKDLNTYEQALGVKRFEAVLEAENADKGGGRGNTGWAGKIATRLHMSKPSVTLYLRIMGGVNPKILEAWASEDPEAQGFCTLNQLDKISGDKDGGLAVYKAWLKAKSEAKKDDDKTEKEGGGSGGRGPKPGGSTRVSKDQITYAIAYATKMEKESEDPGKRAWAKGMREALLWVTGEKKTIGGIDVGESMVKERAKAKEAKKAEKEAEAQAIKEQKEAEKLASATAADKNGVGKGGKSASA